MVLTTVDKGEYKLLQPSISKLNYENANTFSKEIVNLMELEQPDRLAIDFSGISYISSIGISALSVIKGIAKLNNCKVVIFNLNKEISEIFKQTGVESFFPIFETERNVLEYYKYQA